VSDTGQDLNAVAVAGALSSNYARDARTFLPLLAAVVEASMPEDTEVERKGRLFSKEKTVRKVTVICGQNSYEIEDPGNGRLEAKRIQTVRNIVLKREEMHIDEWLRALAAEIAERAKTNEAAFFALKNMLDY
jgi:hypothetical protein